MIPRPSSKAFLFGVTSLAYALMFLPIVTVVALSVFSPATLGQTWGPSLVWYERLLRNEILGDALLRSLQVAAMTSLGASILGTLGAIALERGRFPGRAALDALTHLPLVMPELVLGIASLIWFATLRMTLGLYSMVVAHITFAVSYVVVTVRASLRGFDPALLDAAADLGANRTQVYTRVVLPLIAPGIVAGAMMAFTLSFDDFLISFFTTGVGTDTLPIRLYSMIRFGLNKEMYALSTLLVVATIIAVLAHRALLRKK